MLAHFLHRLLGAEGDEYAKYDDADLLEEVAPCVDGMLGSVNLYVRMKFALSAAEREWGRGVRRPSR
jgi:hypothetical protein